MSAQCKTCSYVLYNNIAISATDTASLLYRESEEMPCTCFVCGTPPFLAQYSALLTLVRRDFSLVLYNLRINYELTHLLKVCVSSACSQAGDWENRPDRVRRFRVRQPSAHVTGRLCVTSRFGPPSWWRVSDVRSRDEGRRRWQRTRHSASYVLPSVTLGH